LLGVSDLEQLVYAYQARRVIFTQDADFLILASQSRDHAGITYCRKQTRSIGQIIAWLELLHGVMTPEEMQGHVEYL
jgi:predicted nuclease of predicted toxin-antitoxin system